MRSSRLLAVILRRLWRLLLDFFRPLWRITPMRAARSSARCAPSRSRIFTSAASACLQRFFHGRPDALRVHQFLVRLENARRAQHLVQRHLAGNFQLLGQPRQFRRVSLGQRQIDVRPRGQFAVRRVDADARRHAAARDAAR